MQDCPQLFSHCFISHFVVSLRSGVSVTYDNSAIVSRLCHCVLINTERRSCFHGVCSVKSWAGKQLLGI